MAVCNTLCLLIESQLAEWPLVILSPGQSVRDVLRLLVLTPDTAVHCSGPGVASLGCVGAGEGGARPLSSDTTIRAWRQSGRVAVTVQCLIVMSENE